MAALALSKHDSSTWVRKEIKSSTSADVGALPHNKSSGKKLVNPGSKNSAKSSSGIMNTFLRNEGANIGFMMVHTRSNHLGGFTIKNKSTWTGALKCLHELKAIFFRKVFHGPVVHVGNESNLTLAISITFVDSVHGIDEISDNSGRGRFFGVVPGRLHVKEVVYVRRAQMGQGE